MDTIEEPKIPAYTIRNKFFSMSKPTNIFRAHILQLLNSSVVERHPYVYKFGGLRYSAARIEGTIISRKLHNSDSVTYIVADQTGCIGCIAFPKIPLQFARETVHQYAGANEDDTLKKAGDIILEKCTRKLQQFPKCSDIYIGDKVAVVGHLKEMDERIIMIWNIQRVQQAVQQVHMKNVRV